MSDENTGEPPALRETKRPLTKVRSMPNDLTFDEIHDILCNVRRMIGHSFYMARSREEVQRWLNKLRVAFHSFDEFINDFAVEAINDIVRFTNLPSEMRIESDISVDRLMQHIDRTTGHFFELVWNLDVRLVNQATSTFGDMHAEVCDTFQLAGNFQYRCDAAQVGRNRLMQGENFKALFFDADVKPINLIVLFREFPGSLDTRLRQFIDGLVNQLFNGCAHRQQIAMQDAKIASEMDGHDYVSNLRF